MRGTAFAFTNPDASSIRRRRTLPFDAGTLKIAFISQYFYPEEYFNNAVATELVNRGHSVHAIPCVPNYGRTSFFEGYSNTERRSEIWNGIQIDRAWTVARGSSRFRLALNYLVYPITASWTLWRTIRTRPDVSFVSMPSPIFQAFAGIFLKWVYGVPCVYWVQDMWPESAIYTLNLRSRVVVRPLTWLCGWLFRRADHVLVQNAGFVPLVARFGVPEDRIEVLPNTARTLYRPVPPADAPEEGQLVPQSGFRLLFAGNVGESQDFETLIEAARLLKDHQDVSWTILGSGRDLERAKPLVCDNGLQSRFVFRGRFPEERMPFFFAHADALLISLKATPIFALTVPSKLQSYFACGKPVIAVLAGEGARVVEEAGAGLVVSPGSPEKLAARILEMKSMSSEELQLHGRRALRYFENHYSNDHVYSRLENTLARVASTKNIAKR